MPETPQDKPVPPAKGKPEVPKPPGPPEGFRGLRVSLMPSEAEEGKPELGRGILILVFVLVIETIIMGGLHFYLSNLEQTKESKLAELQARLAEIQELVVEREALLADASQFGVQIAALEEGLDQHLYWSKFFKFLEGRLRPGIILETFGADAGNMIFNASVYAPTYLAAAEQIVYFRDSPLVDRVMVSSVASRIGLQGTVEGVGFTMTIKMHPEAWLRTPEDVAAEAPEAAEAAAVPAE